MKKILSVGFLAVMASAGRAQTPITITVADMPVVNDTLRYSYAAVGGTINFSNTGANKTWDFSSLTAVSQGFDQYKTAAQVSIAYAALISPTAIGYKVADSIPGASASPIPITVNNIYTFFVKKTNPSIFQAEGFGAQVSGIPTPAVYSDPDEWYIFPLTYNHTDSTTFSLNVSLPGGIASLNQKGYRKTTVDGWGTIKTAFYTTPVNVLRVRSEVVEVDSVTFQGTGLPAIPRHTVEYKWLANGQHYPALWISTTITGTTETPNTIRYRDSYRALGVGGPSTAALQVLDVYPNPATDGRVTVKVPAAWKTYTIEVFDAQGRLVQSGSNDAVLNLQPFASGQYLVRVQSGDAQGFARITK